MDGWMEFIEFNAPLDTYNRPIGHFGGEVGCGVSLLQTFVGVQHPKQARAPGQLHETRSK